MRRCVRSRNHKNDEAMARVGPQRHRKKKQKQTHPSIADIPASEEIVNL
jgi:hypothetical protein